MTLCRILWTPASLAVFALAGCGGGNQTETGVSPEPAPAGQEDIAARAKAKADSARYPYTEADTRFMSHMIGHHAQAIVMSALGAHPRSQIREVRRFAERIINAQQDEIATHAALARDRAASRCRRPTATGMKMTMGGHQHTMLMPGMLTEAQMRQLDAGDGVRSSTGCS